MFARASQKGQVTALLLRNETTKLCKRANFYVICLMVGFISS